MGYDILPERRLWASFLLLLLRDTVPVFVTNLRGEESLRTMSDRDLHMFTSTAIFRLACLAIDVPPSRVRKKLYQIHRAKPDKDFRLRHRARYPSGGFSPLIGMSSISLEEFFE